MAALVEMHGIKKRFGELQALDGVSAAPNGEHDWIETRDDHFRI